MSHKRAKRLRKEVNSIIGAMNWPFAEHEFNPSNADFEQSIKQRGLPQIVKELGYAPLTCTLTAKCRKFHYQKAKRR